MIVVAVKKKANSKSAASSLVLSSPLAITENGQKVNMDLRIFPTFSNGKNYGQPQTQQGSAACA